MLIKKILRIYRDTLIKNKIISKIIADLWQFLPTGVRIRLPITGIAKGKIEKKFPFFWSIDPRELASNKYFASGFSNYEALTQKEVYEIIKNYPLDDFHFLNIGANTGLWCLLVNKRFPKVNCTLIEPSITNLKILQINLKLNNLSAKVISGAAGNKNGFVTLFENPNLLGFASVVNRYSNSSQVRIFKVDDLKTSKLDLVLIDVEGFEFEVIKGMEKTLKKFAPPIIVEISKETQGPIMEFLKKLGYENCKWLGDISPNSPGQKNYLFSR